MGHQDGGLTWSTRRCLPDMPRAAFGGWRVLTLSRCISLRQTPTICMSGLLGPARLYMAARTPLRASRIATAVVKRFSRYEAQAFVKNAARSWERSGLRS